MSIEPLRVITDQWEWASIARHVPTAYHEQSWTMASVTRIRAQTSLPVSFGYARVWVAETMVGCPLIRYGSRWFNTPRAQPLVLSGCHLNAAAALKRATERPSDPVAARLRLPGNLELHDDLDQIDAIDRTRLTLDVRTTSTRTYRTMTHREIDALVRSLDWDDPLAALEWGRAVRTCWRSGAWQTTLRAHRDEDDRLVGYSLWLSRPASIECVAAALVGQQVPAWCSSR